MVLLVIVLFILAPWRPLFHQEEKPVKLSDKQGISTWQFRLQPQLPDTHDPRIREVQRFLRRSVLAEEKHYALNGRFTNNPTDLVLQEPSLVRMDRQGLLDKRGWIKLGGGKAPGYRLRWVIKFRTHPADWVFEIVRPSNGKLVYLCRAPGYSGCRNGYWHPRPNGLRG